MLAGDDAQRALAVQPGGELLEHPGAALVVERLRRAHVPAQLDARAARVDVLAARTAGARGAHVELRARDGDARVHDDRVAARSGRGGGASPRARRRQCRAPARARRGATESGGVSAAALAGGAKMATYSPGAVSTWRVRV
jgi:hypothetical protein